MPVYETGGGVVTQYALRILVPLCMLSAVRKVALAAFKHFAA
jgi:hypothetical protein